MYDNVMYSFTLQLVCVCVCLCTSVLIAMPCRSPVLQKVKWPSQLDRLRSVVKVQDKRLVR